MWTKTKFGRNSRPRQGNTPMARPNPARPPSSTTTRHSGTFVFDAERSRRGYGINMFCMSMMTEENRKASRPMKAAYLNNSDDPGAARSHPSKRTLESYSRARRAATLTHRQARRHRRPLFSRVAAIN